MSETGTPSLKPRRLLLGMTCLTGVAVAMSSAATQFVAYRVNYHPALGTPLLGRFYAPWSWAEWMQAPWAAQAKTTFALLDAGLVGAVAVGMGAAFLISGKGRRRPTKHGGIHGTARFMTTEAEIRGSGLLPASVGALDRMRGVREKPSAGVYVGGWTDKAGVMHYLRHDGPEHCIVIAPTRSGKGVGNILPTLLSWPASALIYDEKGELWQLSSGWRAAAAGNAVLRWEPGAPDCPVGFNFLQEIRLGTPYEVSDAQNVAQMVCDPNGDGIEGKDHWGKTSFDLMAAMILHVMYKAEASGKTGCMADLTTALSDPDRPADVFRHYGQYQSVTGNCHIRIIYAPNEQETAGWVSEMIGNTTIIKEDVTESGTRYGAMKNISRTYHEVSRPLLTPDEIMAMRKPKKDSEGRIIECGQMLAFQAGERPILGEQILYYDDPVFSQRAMIPPPDRDGVEQEPAGTVLLLTKAPEPVRVI